MRRHLIPTACLVLALTACSSDEEPTASEPTSEATPATTAPTETSEPAEPTKAPPPDDCEGLTDASSGRPLCEFKDENSYPYRLAIAQDPDALLSRLQAVAPWLDEGDFSDVISTCAEVAEDRAQPRNAAIRFSGGPGEEVSEAQAVELIAISTEYACP